MQRQLDVDLRSLIVDPMRLVFARIPEDIPVRQLSKRQDLQGLACTTGIAGVRESMLECLTVLLEQRGGDPDPVDIREQAVEWLRHNREAVEHHTGTRSQPVGDACLEKLGTRYAELSMAEEGYKANPR